METLNKGLKYSPNQHLAPKLLHTLVIDPEIALRDQPILIKTKIALKIKKLSKSESHTRKSNHHEKRTIQDIKTKINSNNLILTKADKVQAITILKREENIDKVEFPQVVPEILSSDPTPKFQKQIINTLNESSNYLPKNQNLYSLRIMSPQAPILHGLPKLHKIDHPIRPVVSYINDPAYKICKYLNNLLHGIFTSKFSIKNSLELTQALQHLNIQNSYKLVSFDVKNLFPSIPLSDLKIILEKLINSNNYRPIPKLSYSSINRPMPKSKLFYFQ